MSSRACARLLGLARQLRARKFAEDNLELIAHTDGLKGLSTRRALDIALENEIARLSKSNLDGAMFLAEKIRGDIEKLDFPHEGSSQNRITIFAGFAISDAHTNDWQELVKHAGAALYDAKKPAVTLAWADDKSQLGLPSNQRILTC